MERYWLWLAELKHVSLKHKLELLSCFESPKAIYKAHEKEFSGLPFLTKKERESLENKKLADIDRILDQCDEKNIRILTIDQPEYPQRLRTIADPPVVLYYAGNIPDIDHSVTIGAVGTRNASAYGLLHGKELGYQLGKSGITVISGAARGVDSAALEGAILSGGNVIGVLGNGIDVVYPKSNVFLYEEIKKHGCLFSEYPPGSPPNGDHFPQRNRIISGLSLGVLVIEAPMKSGALITAECALNEGRDVFAIPGSLDCPTTKGNNRLLKDGAVLVENGTDIVREYLSVYPSLITEEFSLPDEFATVPKQAETTTEAAPVLKKVIDKSPIPHYIDWEKWKKAAGDLGIEIMKCLLNGDKTSDDLIDELDCPVSKLLTAVTFLEIRGCVKRLPGQRFALTDKILTGETNG